VLLLVQSVCQKSRRECFCLSNQSSVPRQIQEKLLLADRKSSSIVAVLHNSVVNQCFAYFAASDAVFAYLVC
jgi:hypothetical protein